jgi:uncharacterized membrane protein YgcG
MVPGGALVLAYWMGVQPLSGTAAAATRMQAAVFLLATFSNTVFMVAVAIRNAVRITPASAAFFLGALIVDLAVAAVLPVFAHQPTYWIWVASIAVIAWAFIALPGSGQSTTRTAKRKSAATRATAVTTTSGSVPGIVWGALVVIVFWSLVPYATPGTAATDGTGRTPDSSTPLSAYVTDSAQVLTSGDVQGLTTQLTELDQTTSTQLAVAIYPDSPASVEDFTVRVAEASHLGSSGVDDGAVLFVFPSARIARLEVGYGLEPVLNDAKIGRLLETTFGPAWSRGDHAEALTATVDALGAIVREAHSAGRTTTRAAVVRRRFAVGLGKLRQGALPALESVPLGRRLFLTFFIVLLGAGLFSGGRGAITLARLATRRIAGRRAGRPVDSIDLDSMWDSVKVMAMAFGMVLAAAGAVVVAGGGRFGGGGAFCRW